MEFLNDNMFEGIEGNELQTIFDNLQFDQNVGDFNGLGGAESLTLQPLDEMEPNNDAGCDEDEETKTKRKKKKPQKKRIVSPCSSCNRSYKALIEKWNSLLVDATGYGLDMLGCSDIVDEAEQKATRARVFNAAKQILKEALNEWWAFGGANPPTELSVRGVLEGLESMLAVDDGVDKPETVLEKCRELLKKATSMFAVHPSFIHRECLVCKATSRVPSTFLVMSSEADLADGDWSAKIGANSSFNGGPGNCAKKVATRKLRTFRKYLLNQTVSEETKLERLAAWNERAKAIFDRLKNRLSLVRKGEGSQTLDSFYNTEDDRYRYLAIFPIQITRSARNFLRVPKKAREQGFSSYMSNLKGEFFSANYDRKVRLRENPDKVFAYDCFMSRKIRTHEVREDAERRNEGGEMVWVAHVFKNRSITQTTEDRLTGKYAALRRHMIRNIGVVHAKELKRFSIPRITDTIYVSGKRGLSAATLKRVTKRFCCSQLSLTPVENNDVVDKSCKKYRVEYAAPKPIIPLLRRELQDYVKAHQQPYLSQKSPRINNQQQIFSQ